MSALAQPIEVSAQAARRSGDEQEIRDAVVRRLRGVWPEARIVHELNVAGTGSNRIDVAAIAPAAIIGVEIKSKRDTLKRLPDQWTAFNQCCHEVYVAAHEKHFEPQPHGWAPRLKIDDRRRPSIENAAWLYRTDVDVRGWKVKAAFRCRPLNPAGMLDMLWREELAFEACRARCYGGARATRHDMGRELAWYLTGREVVEAVCRQLRAREFVEADPAQPLGAS